MKNEQIDREMLKAMYARLVIYHDEFGYDEMAHKILDWIIDIDPLTIPSCDSDDPTLLVNVFKA